VGLTDALEAQARGEVRRSGRLALRFVESALIVASCLLLGILLYQAQFSGTVRWLLGFALVAALTVIAWMRVSSGTQEPAPLASPPARADLRTGELTSFTAVVERAERGLAYSQLVVSSRVRDAFAERARLALGLPPDAIRAISADAAALRSRIHDRTLEDLMLLETTDKDERYRWVSEARERGFLASIERVLDRMEAWR